MAYGYGNPYFPAGYQPYVQPAPQMVQQPQQVMQPAQPQPVVVWVKGEAEAKSYMVAAGQSVLLMDSDNKTFYVKSTDASGMPQPLRVFDFAERSIEQKASAPADLSNYVTKAELEQALAALAKGGDK